MTNIHQLYTRRRRTQTGSLLFDALIGLTILVMSLLPLMLLLLGSRSVGRQTSLQSLAANMAQLEMDSIRSRSFASILAMQTTSSSFALPPPGMSATMISNQYGTTVPFTGKYSVKLLSGVGDSNHQVLQIVVRVSYVRPDTKTTTYYQMDSYVALGASTQ